MGGSRKSGTTTLHGRLRWFLFTVVLAVSKFFCMQMGGYCAFWNIYGREKKRKERKRDRGREKGGGGARGWELEVGNTAHHGRLTLFFGLSVNFSARTALEERLL